MLADAIDSGTSGDEQVSGSTIEKAQLSLSHQQRSWKTRAEQPSQAHMDRKLERRIKPQLNLAKGQGHHYESSETKTAQSIGPKITQTCHLDMNSQYRF